MAESEANVAHALKKQKPSGYLEGFDLVLDRAQESMSADHRMADLLAVGMASSTSVPWTMEELYLQGPSLTDQMGALILGTDLLSREEKRAVQLRYIWRARLWSRFTGILHTVARRDPEGLRESGYLLDRYTEDPDQLVWGRFSGYLMRILLTYALTAAARVDAACGVEQAFHRGRGTRIVIDIPAASHLSMRVQVQDLECAAA